MGKQRTWEDKKLMEGGFQLNDLPQQIFCSDDYDDNEYSSHIPPKPANTTTSNRI